MSCVNPMEKTVETLLPPTAPSFLVNPKTGLNKSLVYIVYGRSISRCGDYSPLIVDCAEVGVFAVCKDSILGKGSSHVRIYATLVRKLFIMLAAKRVVSPKARPHVFRNDLHLRRLP